MKTIFDKATRDELIARIQALDEKNSAGWGKMTVNEMVCHCIAWEEMTAGKQKHKQGLIGLLFGKMALKGMIGDDKPVKQHMPTLPELKITGDTGDFEVEKSRWIALLEKNSLTPNPNFVHPFFGKMTVEQIGLLDYKHTDHHLRQFNG